MKPQTADASRREIVCSEPCQIRFKPSRPWYPSDSVTSGYFTPWWMANRFPSSDREEHCVLLGWYVRTLGVWRADAGERISGVVGKLKPRIVQRDQTGSKPGKTNQPVGRANVWVSKWVGQATESCKAGINLITLSTNEPAIQQKPAAWQLTNEPPQFVRRPTSHRCNNPIGCILFSLLPSIHIRCLVVGNGLRLRQLV